MEGYEPVRLDDADSVIWKLYLIIDRGFIEVTPHYLVYIHLT